jgi:sugar phosphate isomerase/epimerase
MKQASSFDPQKRIAISSWSIHRLLGVTYANGPADNDAFTLVESFGPAQIAIHNLPFALAFRGYHRIELCHFHLQSLEPEFLRSVGDVFRRHNVVIQTLLIDDGDITNPATQKRDIAWISKWIVAAAELGAENVRIIAGKAPPSDEVLTRSLTGLSQLATFAADRGVRPVTENWFDTLSTPKAVHQLLDGVGSILGFMVDTGNWSGPTKYEDLQAVFGRAELCHAKAHFHPRQVIDQTDFDRCLAIAEATQFRGPLTLIFEGDGDEWKGLAQERDAVLRHFTL